MLKKNSDGIYQSSLLLTISGLKHGFSSRRLGDMRKTEAREKFLKKLKLSHNLTLAEQIHGNIIRKISSEDLGQSLAGVDGLISSPLESTQILGILVADCLPILAVDPVSKVIGAAHAGWRGTLFNISKNLIAAMNKSGAKPSNVLISIGPHIRSCCYDVDDVRAQKFLNLFPGAEVVIKRQNKHYLDLAAANVKELLQSGVLKSNIDLCLSCTFNEKAEFFSYRRDEEPNFGKMMGVISYDRKN